MLTGLGSIAKGAVMGTLRRSIQAGVADEQASNRALKEATLRAAAVKWVAHSPGGQAFIGGTAGLTADHYLLPAKSGMNKEEIWSAIDKFTVAIKKQHDYTNNETTALARPDRAPAAHSTSGVRETRLPRSYSTMSLSDQHSTGSSQANSALTFWVRSHGNACGWS